MTTELLELGFEVRARLLASEQAKKWLRQTGDEVELRLSPVRAGLRRPKTRELEAS